MAFDPTGMEQEMLEYTNWMRMDPQGALDVLFTTVGDPLPVLPVSPDAAVNAAITGYYDPTSAEIRSEWALLTPTHPLAWHEILYNTADSHSQLMIQYDDQLHQLPGEQTLGVRIGAAGYNFSYAGENIFAYAQSVFHGHSAFAIDWNVSNRSHRDNLMDPTFQEIGIAIVPESNSGTDVGPLVITQDFGVRGGSTGDYLLGVVYDDVNANNRYDAGEGYGNVNIEVDGPSGNFTTTTMTAGGYQLIVPPGTYTVTATGGGLSGPLTVIDVVIGGSNVKVDLQPGVNDEPQYVPVANGDAYSADENSTLYVPGPGVLGNDTDGNGDSLTAVLVTGPSNGTLTLNADGSFDYTPTAGYHGLDSFTYRANDGQANSNTAQVNLRVADPLGVVGFATRPDQDPSSANRWYRLQTARQGVLSLEAVFSGAPDSADLTLYDNGGSQLTTSSLVNGRQRIDWDVNVGETLLVRLSGTNNDVDVTMVNLVYVSPDGSQVTVYDSAGDDTFEATIGSPIALTIDGVSYQFSLATVVELFGGSGGIDTVNFYDSPGNDLFVTTPGYGRLTGNGLSLQAISFHNVNAYAPNGGYDSARMYDSAGDDIFYATPVETTLYRSGGGDAFFNRVKYFEDVQGFAPAGGYDVGFLFDSAGDDTFYAAPAEGALRGPTGGGTLGDQPYSNRVKQVEEVRGDASQGGNDRAEFYDGPGDDVFYATPTQGWLSGRGYYSLATNFDRIDAFAGSGEDRARLLGSAGDDNFYGSPIESAMYGAGYYNQARYFERVYADASTGDADQADLFDSGQVDLLEAASDWARLSNASLDFLYEVLAFDLVNATATTPGDTADVTGPLEFTLDLQGLW